ncbi:FAD-binding protein [Bacteroidales bacterium AH-315-I05]|nr:FAD-binding protein [Bacteroidales bacterium AH-315-I05]
MTAFNKISLEALQKFQFIVGENHVFTDNESLSNYAHDETEDLNFPPEVVLKPVSAEEISEILKICNAEKIPVTPIGGKTGLSGGALSVHGGVALSTERLNQIIEIDEKNLQATVEPGVITQVFQEAVIEKGLFYPPDPSSKGSCFLGGNLAENAGGPKAVKYGVTNDYVLNLEVVLPKGEIIWTGANVLKNSTGYNLTQLLIGSEGTLGIITKIVFKLIPFPKHNLLMLVPFSSAEKACEAVAAVFRAGITPSALEFMERDAIDWVMEFVPDINISVKDEIKAHLLVEVDGNDLDVLYKDCEQISEVMQQHECDEILFADTADQKETLWKMRRRVAEAVKANSVYKEEDTVVPRYELPKLLKGVKEIGERYGFKSVCYGHAGDGNLHVNIVKGEMDDEKWKTVVVQGIREIFELTVSLGGTLSGEHGIGWVQKPYMDIAFNKPELELQKGIKKLFDPNGILNPGKIFP